MQKSSKNKSLEHKDSVVQRQVYSITQNGASIAGRPPQAAGISS